MMLRNLLASVGAISIAVFLYQNALPLLNSERVITEGNYRSLEIGATKGEVIGLLTNSSDRFSKFKLTSYTTMEGHHQPLFYEQCKSGRIIDADTWYAAYPGFQNEIVELKFDGGLLAQIRYTRAILDP